MSVKPNRHGVRTPQERLQLPRDMKSWRGCSVAEIELADLGTHWIWATGFQMMTGDCWGSGGPLVDHPSHRSSTREAAIEAASAHLREKVGKRVGTYPDARRIMDWLDGLRPAQSDLFGAAA